MKCAFAGTVIALVAGCHEGAAPAPTVVDVPTGTSAAPLATTTSDPKPRASLAPVDAGWGKEAKTKSGAPISIHARLRTERWKAGDVEAAVDVGDPIKLVYEVENTGKSPVSLWHAGFWPNHRIVLHGPDGSAPAWTPLGQSGASAFSPEGPRDKNVDWPIPPGKIDASEGGYDLRDLAKVDVVGHYTVAIDYEDDIAFSTNVLSLWVLPRGATHLLDDLNAWDHEECDVHERPAKYPNRVASGETNGFIDTRKSELTKLGVTVEWDAPAMRYRVVDAH